MVYGLTASLSISLLHDQCRDDGHHRAALLLLLAAQTNALPKWLRWPGKTKEQKAVERVLNEFERDEFTGASRGRRRMPRRSEGRRATAKLCHPDKNSDSRAPSASTRARRLRHPVGPRRGASTTGGGRRGPRGEEEPKKKVRLGRGPLGGRRYRVWVFMSWVLVKTLLA